MRHLYFLLLVGGLLGSAPAARAQTTPAYDPTVVHRQVWATGLWPEAQGEFALRNGDYLLVSARGERTLGDYSSNRILGFDGRRALLGYEHFWSPQWSVGGTARLLGSGGSTGYLVPEVLLRHRSLVFGGLTFGQRLGVERTIPFVINSKGAIAPEGEFWSRLRVEVERFVYLGPSQATSLALRPRLSYEAATHLRLQKADTDPDERTIQYTSLRAEVGVRVLPQLDFTPWFAYQTTYLQSAVFTDAKGTPVSGGKINQVMPTFGLDLRYTLLPTGVKTARQQLPTQH